MPAWTERDWDHERDERKNDFPIRLEPKPPTTALEIAVLVQAIDLTKGAALIEQYGLGERRQPRQLDHLRAGGRSVSRRGAGRHDCPARQRALKIGHRKDRVRK